MLNQNKMPVIDDQSVSYEEMKKGAEELLKKVRPKIQSRPQSERYPEALGEKK
jgi:hypothetical protein